MVKTATKAEGEAVSNETTSAQPQETQSQALVTTGDGDVSGPMSLAFSQEARDEIARKLSDRLHRVKEGFGELTAPNKIAQMGAPFNVIDAIIVTNYVDKKTGEEKTKVVFKLEFEGGLIKFTMQGAAGPRLVLAELFQEARLAGYRVVAGPYRYISKEVGQIQPAWIFEQQPGFDARLLAA